MNFGIPQVLLGLLLIGFSEVSPACAGEVEADGFFYRDASGLDVTTSLIHYDQSVVANGLLRSEFLWDRISTEVVSSNSASGGHHHAARIALDDVEGTVPETHNHLAEFSALDAVSGASPRSGGPGGSVEHRFEGMLGFLYSIGHGDTPHSLGVTAKLSKETDYLSVTGIASGTIELLQRNLTLSTYLGFGSDRIDPNPVPPGETDRWPANQYRYLAGLGISQVTGIRSLISFGYGLTALEGTLEGPYRRATVVTTLFPEHVPSRRYRHTAAATWSYSPWNGTAIHHSEGVYLDSWGVKAWIPETAISQEIGEAWIVNIRCRFSRQNAADFWQHHYENLEGWRTGDFRLDGLEHEALSEEMQWRHEWAAKTLVMGLQATQFYQRSDHSGIDPKGWIVGMTVKWLW